MSRDESSMTLLSASVDGQLAVFDLSAGLDEDDAFQVSILEGAHRSRYYGATVRSQIEGIWHVCM